jgi:hypothetical protein
MKEFKEASKEEIFTQADLKGLRDIYDQMGILGIPPLSQAIMDKLAVFYRGWRQMYLNPQLVYKQKISVEDVAKLKELHHERLDIFDCMLMSGGKPEVLKVWAKRIEELEYSMQAAWKFNIDKSFHSWWYQVPYCKCPKLDNDNVLGTGMVYINTDCPIHGKSLFLDLK